MHSDLHELTYLFWECTLKCNLNCLHCGSDCTKDPNVKDMPFEDFLSVLKDIKNEYDPKNIIIVITGGEPLLRNDLAECGRKITELGFHWGIVTNGMLLTKEKLFELVEAGIKTITLSIDGLENNHNWMRDNDSSFRKAIEAAKIISISGIPHDVVTCINDRNYQELDEIKNFLVDIGIKKWRIFNITPIGRAADNPELNISAENLRGMLEFIKRIKSEGSIKVDYACEGFLGEYENQAREGYHFCSAGINIASVLCDGTISACPNINRAFSQGNIYQDDFIDVWNNKFHKMRDRDQILSSECLKCDVKNWCKGGGMHLQQPDNKKVLRCHYQLLKKDK